MLYRFQRHKAYLWEMMGSASRRAMFLSQKYKGISKFIKEKFSRPAFWFYYFKIFCLLKSDQRLQLLRSRRFFRHQDCLNRLMSYFDAYASYDIKCHIMTNDAYDIEMNTSQIGRSWCPKWLSWPQQSHPVIRFWQYNFFKIEKCKTLRKVLYKSFI